MSADGAAVEEPLSPGVLARRARPYLPALLMVLGIALAAYGQYELIQTRDASIDGALPYIGVGAVLFVTGLWLDRRHHASYFPGVESGPGDQASPFPLPFRERQWIGLALGIAGLYGGIVFNGENSFTLGGVAIWFLGIAGFLWGFWKFGGDGEQRLEPKEDLRSWLPVAAALALVTALAFFLRFYRLDGVPREMEIDDAITLVLIDEIRQGQTPVFYVIPSTVFEPLFHYLTAAFVVPFTGVSFMALKIAGGLVGVATVLATYGMARELFESRRVAVLAAALLALGYWPIVASRVGLPFVMTPLFVALTLLFLFRAIKHNRPADFLLCGLFLGVGAYTYSSFRLMPVVVGLPLLHSLADRVMKRRPDVKPYLVNSLLLVMITLIVFAPMAGFLSAAPDDYFRRTGDYLTKTEDVSTASLVVKNLKLQMLMFTWKGERFAHWNADEFPQLDYLTASLFILGFAALVSGAIIRWSARYAYAVVAFFVLLIPNIAIYYGLGYESVMGESARAIGVLPLVFAIAALPLHLTAEAMSKALGRRWLMAALPFLGVSLALIGFFNYDRLFDDFLDQRRKVDTNTWEIAAAFHDFEDAGGKLEDAYFLTDPGLHRHLAQLAIELGEPAREGTPVNVLGKEDLLNASEVHRQASDPDAKMYLLYPQDVESLAQLRQTYPEGRAYQFDSDVDRDFWIFLIPSQGQTTIAPLSGTTPLQ